MGVIIAPRPGAFPPPFPQQEVPFNTAGILIPGVEARIVREDGADVEYGEPGELWVTGGNIALGYWGNPRATAETFFEDAQGRRWLKTGDRFRVDKEGWFFFEDRIKVSRAPLFPSALSFRLTYSRLRILSKSMGCRSHPQRSKSRCWTIQTNSLSMPPSLALHSRAPPDKTPKSRGRGLYSLRMVVRPARKRWQQSWKRGRGRRSASTNGSKEESTSLMRYVICFCAQLR